MILWRTDGNYAKNTLHLLSGLLLRYHEYGDVHVLVVVVHSLLARNVKTLSRLWAARADLCLLVAKWIFTLILS